MRGIFHAIRCFTSTKPIFPLNSSKNLRREKSTCFHCSFQLCHRLIIKSQSCKLNKQINTSWTCAKSMQLVPQKQCIDRRYPTTEKCYSSFRKCSPTSRKCSPTTEKCYCTIGDQETHIQCCCPVACTCLESSMADQESHLFTARKVVISLSGMIQSRCALRFFIVQAELTACRDQKRCIFNAAVLLNAFAWKSSIADQESHLFTAKKHYQYRPQLNSP